MDRSDADCSAGGAADRMKDVAREFASLSMFPVASGRTVVRGIAAERARRKLAELTERGEVPRPAADYPPTSLNRSLKTGRARGSHTRSG